MRDAKPMSRSERRAQLEATGDVDYLAGLVLNAEDRIDELERTIRSERASGGECDRLRRRVDELEGLSRTHLSGCRAAKQRIRDELERLQSGARRLLDAVDGSWLGDVDDDLFDARDAVLALLAERADL